MIVAHHNVTNKNVLRWIEKANKVLSNPEFYMKIRSKSGFDMSTASGADIADTMKLMVGIKTLTVKTYYKRYSRANAYFEPWNPSYIYINTAKTNRSDGSGAATVVHEWVHMVDKFDGIHSYGHGDNSSKGKQNTAPYWIDNVAQAIIDEHFNYNNNESSTIKYKRRWYSYLNPRNWFR